MANLLDLLGERSRKVPLAEQLRPTKLDDFIGQRSIIGEGTPLRNLIASGSLTSLIFWGPPGTGKTTLARIIAERSDAQFIELSAVSSGIADLRKVVESARETLNMLQKQTILFIDEIHRYNKAQQDALLPYVENGTLTLIGSTTENPSFQVISALLSRVIIVHLQYLNREEIKELLNRGIEKLSGNDYHSERRGGPLCPPESERRGGPLCPPESERRGGPLCPPESPPKVEISPEALSFIVDYANGDGRSSLNLLETAYKCASLTEDKRVISVELLENLSQHGRLNYDRQGDEHYDHASAYQKSMRGSDPDASLYWLGKMIAAGEDPRFIARRLIVTASEDVGNADPMALVLALSALEAVEKLGLPEGRIPLAQATIYVAKARKSNQTIVAIDKVLNDIQQKGEGYPVPPHLKDSHYKDAAARYGHGRDYVYSHDHPEVKQNFLPEALIGRRYLDHEEQ